MEQEDTILTIFLTISVTHNEVPLMHDATNETAKDSAHKPNSPYARNGIGSKCSLNLFIK
ncbi:hypothetical protein PEA128_orf017 [Klebsiella phage PEA128]|nr:hypothetical protein PEA128_orf017 [Klebsiella phage PEA128]